MPAHRERSHNDRRAGDSIIRIIVSALLLLATRPPVVRAQTIASAANQLFHVNDPATPISVITVADSIGGTIQSQGNRGIYISIPAGFNMTWDTSVLTATLSGNAAGRCSPTVSYLSGNLTVKITVNSTFAAGDRVIIAGLRFANFTAISGPSQLQLATKSTLQVVATDPQTITIGPYYNGSLTPASQTLTSLPTNGGSLTASFTLTNTGAANDSYDLLALPTPGVALSVVSITGVSITQGTNPDSARRATLASMGTGTVTVSYRIATVANGTLDTLKLTGRSVGNPAKTTTAVLIVTIATPVLTLGKAVSPGGAPGPGSNLTITWTVTNTGSANATNVAVVDSFPSWVQYKMASATATLPAGVSAAIEFSSDGGATWAYVPVSGGCGAPSSFDRCVNRIRWRLLAALPSTAGSNQGTLQFVSQIR
jgi:uncharacterized repeat protein (TIGR01451 family)